MAKEVDIVALGELLIDFTEAGYAWEFSEKNFGGRRNRNKISDLG